MCAAAPLPALSPLQSHADSLLSLPRQSLLGRLTGTVTRLLPETWVPAWLQEREEEEPPEPRPGPATRRNHLNAPSASVTDTASAAWGGQTGERRVCLGWIVVPSTRAGSFSDTAPVDVWKPLWRLRRKT